MIKDRFLIGIFIGISALVIAALILFFARQGQVSYVDDSTPEGALRNYFLAIQKQDYDRAYDYLANQPSKPGIAQFRQQFVSGYQGKDVFNTAVEVLGAEIDETSQTATVQVNILRGSEDVFGGSTEFPSSAMMVLEDGTWKVMSAPHPYSFPESPWFVPTRPPVPTPTPYITPST